MLTTAIGATTSSAIVAKDQLRLEMRQHHIIAEH
jgi:hypothetical protein